MFFARRWKRVVSVLLNLAKLIDRPGETLPFSVALVLSALDFGGCRPVREPLVAEGQVRNTAGVLLLTGRMHTTLQEICDRCAEPFTRAYDAPLRAILVTELADEQDADENTFLLQGDCADLDEIVATAFILQYDAKRLCREDCKGLCPQCGANLNLGPCHCKKEVDPRLAALGQLLENT